MKTGAKEHSNWKKLDTEETPFLVHYHKVWLSPEPYIFLMDFFPVRRSPFFTHTAACTGCLHQQCERGADVEVHCRPSERFGLDTFTRNGALGLEAR